MKRVLLVEPDEELRQTLTLLLSRVGCEVVEAENGRSALIKCQQSIPDLVITEMIMPEMDGVETIIALQKLCPGIKIVAISGGGLNPAETYLKIARILGVGTTLVKPFTPKELFDAIQSFVPLRRSNADHGSNEFKPAPLQPGNDPSLQSPCG